MADALDVKRPEIHAKPLEILWRLDWFVSNVFQQRENYRKATARAFYRKQLFKSED
jgi:hypothetical protein